MKRIRTIGGALALLSAASGWHTFAQPRGGVVDDAALKAAASKPDDWITYGRDYAETHFTPLDQINSGNVNRLGLVWSYATQTDGGFEDTPLIADGVLYGTGSWSVVFAVDAKSGAEKWRWDPKVDRAFGSHACCGPNNRGVALYEGKVYVGVLDGRLVALDEKTGREVWAVKTTQDEYQTITGAPRVVKGKVIIGFGGAEFGTRGYVSAYDARSGKLAWRFYTVPGDPAKGPDGAASDRALEKVRDSWKKATCREVGCGGTVWDALAYDPAADLLYVGVGNGSPWNREVRDPGGGDNLFVSSIIALRPETGELVWHYQTTPGESWDFTATQSLILADLPINGRTRKVIMQAPKNGFFYVLDRITGELLSGQAFTDLNWATGIDMKTGRPIETENARYVKAPELVWVAGGGAHSWQPMAYSPRTKLAYIPGANSAFSFAQDPNYRYQRGRQNFGAAFTRPQNAQNPPGPPGYLVAWDVAANKERWRIPYQGRPGGVLATGGNLVFNGAPDGKLLAYSADQGQKLWDVAIPGGGISTPVSYLLDGKQYVSVLAGRGNGRLYTFMLDGKAAMPVAPAPAGRAGPPEGSGAPPAETLGPPQRRGQ